MPDSKRPDSKPQDTYDDIARRTVPLPDSSHRPSREQVQRAHEPPPPPLETAADVAELRAALIGERVDVDDVTFQQDGDTLVVRGSVATDRDRLATLAAAHQLAGITHVIDELRVRL
jgi:hypothetical protein